MTLAPLQLDTFARVLMEEIRTHRPELLKARFTVAEIYQALVPYQTHRTRLGTEIIEDYDEALLRLLTGEGGFLKLESESVRERLLAELETRNPNLGIFRSFAAAEVHPGPAALALDPAAGAPAKPVEPTAPAPPIQVPEVVREPVSVHAPQPEPASTAEPSPFARQAAVPEVVPPTPALAGSRCPACSRDLPEHPDLRFCPFCGVDVQRPKACAGCGEFLDPSWRFCIRCGDPAAAS